MKQPDLFDDAPKRPKLDPDARDKRKIVRAIRSAVKGGLVNGMTKAQLRRHAPAKLPRVTIYD